MLGRFHANASRRWCAPRCRRDWLGGGALLALRAARAAAALAGTHCRHTRGRGAGGAPCPGFARADIAGCGRKPRSTGAAGACTEPSNSNGEKQDNEPSLEALDDMMCAAVQSALPPGLLESLKNGAGLRAAPSPRDGCGQARISLLRGPAHRRADGTDAVGRAAGAGGYAARCRALAARAPCADQSCRHRHQAH